MCPIVVVETYTGTRIRNGFGLGAWYLLNCLERAVSLIAGSTAAVVNWIGINERESVKGGVVVVTSVSGDVRVRHWGTHLLQHRRVNVDWACSMADGERVWGMGAWYMAAWVYGRGAWGMGDQQWCMPSHRPLLYGVDTDHEVERCWLR